MAADSTLSVDIQATDEASPALKALGNAASEVASKAASAASPVQELGEHATKAGENAEEAGGLFGHFKESLMDVAKVAGGIIAGNVLLDLTKGIGEQFGSVIKDTQQFGEQVRVLGQNMGISSQDASTLVVGMKDLGINADTGTMAFTRFAKGLQGVDDGIDKIIPGGKSAIDTLKDMGVATVETGGKQLPFMQVLGDVADKFSTMKDSTEKTTIATSLFGRTTGTDMIPLLNQGRAGIEEIAASAQKYGLQLSTENVGAIRQFTLAHNEMNQAVEGAKLQIGTALIPVLTDLVKGLTNTVVGVRGFLDALNETFGITDLFKAAMSGIGDAVGRAFHAMQQWAGEHNFQDWALRIVAYGAVVAEGLGELVGAFGEALGGILQIVISVGELIYEALSYLNPFAPHSPPLVNQVQDGLALIKKEFAGLVDVQPALQALGGGFKELEAALKDTLQSAKDALQDFKASTQTSLDGAKDALQTFKDAAQDRIRAVEDGLQAFKDSVQTSLQAAQDSFSALQQSVQDNIASMQDGLSQLQDAVSATNDQISNLKQQLTDLQNQPVGDEVEIEKAKLAVMQAQVDVDQDGGQASKDSLTTAQAHLKLLQDQHSLAQQTASVNAQPQVTAITAQIAALTTQKTAQGEAVKQKQEEIKAAQQAGQATIKAAQEGLQAQQRAAQEEIKAHEKAAAAAKQAIQDEVKDKQKAYDDDLKAFQGVVKQKEDAIAKLQEAEQAAAAAQSAASAGGKGAGAGGGLAGAIKGAGGMGDLKDIMGGAGGIGEKLKQAMDEAKTNMAGFKTAIDGVAGPGGSLEQFAKRLDDIAKALDKQNSQDSGTWYTNLATTVQTALTDMGTSFDKATAQIGTWAQGLGTKLGEWLKQSIPQAFQGLSGLDWGGILSMGLKIAEWPLLLIAKIGVAADGIILGFVNGLIKGLSGFDVGGWLDQHLIQPVKRFLGIASPSTVFQEIAVQVVQGLTQGMVKSGEEFIGNLQTWLQKNLVQPAKDFIQDAANIMERGKEAVDQVWKGITDKAGEFAGNIKTWIQTNIVQPFTDAAGTFMAIGKSIVDAIGQGLANAWGGFVATLQGLIANLPHPNIGSGGSGGGASGPAPNPEGKAFVDPTGQPTNSPSNGGVANAPARASGGPVSANRTYLVGEQGPELFESGTDGFIVPNGAGGGIDYDRLANAIVGAMGSGNVNILMDGQQVATMVRKNLLRQGQSLTTLWGN